MIRYALLLAALAATSAAAHHTPDGAIPGWVLAEHYPASGSGGDWRGCPGGVPGIIGIRHDQNRIGCMGMPSARGWDVGPERTSRQREDGLPLQWPNEDYPDFAVEGYRGPSMHWCGPYAFVSAYNVPRNHFTCRSLEGGPFDIRPLETLVVDASDRYTLPGHFTWRSLGSRVREDENVPPADQTEWMHGCPDGYILVGMHHDANIFLCGLVIPE